MNITFKHNIYGFRTDAAEEAGSFQPGEELEMVTGEVLQLFILCDKGFVQFIAEVDLKQEGMTIAKAKGWLRNAVKRTAPDLAEGMKGKRIAMEYLYGGTRNR